MENSTTVQIENNRQKSDKALIAKLKYELEECKDSNLELQKTIQKQKFIIEEQAKTISHNFKFIDNQVRMVKFLNDWKFKDHRFQTDLRVTCNN